MALFTPEDSIDAWMQDMDHPVEQGVLGVVGAHLHMNTFSVTSLAGVEVSAKEPPQAEVSRGKISSTFLSWTSSTLFAGRVKLLLSNDQSHVLLAEEREDRKTTYTRFAQSVAGKGKSVLAPHPSQSSAPALVAAERDDSGLADVLAAAVVDASQIRNDLWRAFLPALMKVHAYGWRAKARRVPLVDR